MAEVDGDPPDWAEGDRRARGFTHWHPALRVVTVVASAMGVVGLGLWALSLVAGQLFGDWSWGEEARRPLEVPRDTAKAEEIVAWVHQNGNCDDYYVELPHRYDAFTAGGLSSCWGEVVFLPQWSGVPDDAGGYWYSPHESPDGYDMWGMICKDPVDLGEGWWRCGMGD